MADIQSILDEINNRGADGAPSRDPLPRDQRSSTRISVDEAIDRAAERHRLDPRLLHGIVHTESNYNPQAVSGAGAVGPMQVLPSTARGMGYNPADLTDPEVGIDAGARYFRQQLDAANGDVNLALRYYHGGRDPKNWGPINEAYPGKVLQRANEYPGGEIPADVYANTVMARGRHYDQTQGSDIGRGFSNAWNSTLNDMTSGLSGYSAASQGYREDAASNYAEHRRRAFELAEQTRPQDTDGWQALKEGNYKEFFGDYVPYTVGSAAGSSLPSLGSGLAGAGAGFIVGGPPGAIVGGIAGAAIPLLSQYLGSTWADNTSRKLQEQKIDPNRASLGQIQAASDMTPGEFARVTGAAFARSGIELGGDALLGGFGGKIAKSIIKPKGLADAATNLLDKTALRRVGTAALGEGAAEVADVPLSDIGAGRDWSGPEDYANAFMGGVIGGAGMRGTYEVAKNPGATFNAISQGISDTAAKTQWGQERYRNKMGERIDSVVQGQVDAQNEKDEERFRQILADVQAQEDAEAERNRIPTPREMHEQMLAAHQAKMEAAKLPKVTEDDYYAETEKYDNPEDLPAHLTSFGAYKTYRKKTDKAEQAKRYAEVGPAPTMQEALQKRNELIRDRNAAPKKFYVNPATGQMDMWGYEYGKGEVTPPEQTQPTNAVEYPGTPDPRQMQTELDFGNGFERPGEVNNIPRLPNLSIEDALNRAQSAKTPEEQEAWLRTAIAREAEAKDKPAEQRPTAEALQATEKAQQDMRGQIESAQGAVNSREAERGSLAEQRNQAYDQLEAEQAAEKDRQLQEMERQNTTDTANRQMAAPVFAPDLLINKKAPSTVKPRPGTTPTQTQENIAALEAQNKEAQRHNTFALAVEQNKQRMLAKAITALRKTGAQIQDNDKLQWTGGKWSLFPREYRGRPPAGHFYADMFNQAGEKIGKVLRPETLPPTPPEDDGNAQGTSSQDGKREDGNGQAEKKPRRRGTRRVSKAEGQSEANDAAQGQEINNAEQVTEASPVDGGSSAQPEVRKGRGRSRKGSKGVQSSGQENGNAQEEAALTAEIKQREEEHANGTLKDADAEALIKRIQAFEKAKRKSQHDSLTQDAVAAAAGDYTDVKGETEGEPLDFNDVEWMASSKPSSGTANANQIQSVLDEHQATYGDRLGIKFRFFDSPEHAFGPGAPVPENAKGFYNPKSGIIGVFGNSVGGVRDLRETLSHELFGHFGLNTLSPLEKFALLARIARSQGNLFVKRAFDKVKTDQPHLANNELKVAEEVFARAAESVDKFWAKVWDAIASKVLPLLRDLGWVKSETSIAELRVMARKIASDIRSGEATQQNFPKKADTQFRSTKDSISEFSDKALDTAFGDVVGSGLDFVKSLTVAVNNTAWLAKWRPDLKSLQKIHDSESKMQDSQGQNANAVMDKVEDLRSLPKVDRKKLFPLMIDSTVARMHPDLPLSDKANAHISDTPENQQTHKELADRYAALSPAAKKAYSETRDLFQHMFDQRKKALFALSQRLLSPAKAAELKTSIDHLVKQGAGPYFPLSRFGDYVMVWKSKDFAKAEEDNDTKKLETLKADREHYEVSFHKSEFAAKRALERKKAEAGDRTAMGKKGSYFSKRTEFDGGVTMGLSPLVSKMQDAIETKLGAEVGKEAKAAMSEVFIASLADTNVLKSSLKRANVAGVKPEEMLQAIAKHGSAQSFYISRLEHMADIQEALKALQLEDRIATNATNKPSVYSTVSDGLSGMYTPDPNTIMTRAISTTNFLLYNGRLALSPAFWITNSLAPITVSVPYMSGRFKINKVLAQYRAAAADAIKVVMPRGMKGGDLGQTFKDAIRFSLYDVVHGADFLKNDEREMLVRLMDEGLLDENQIRELSNVASGNIGIRDNLARVLGAIPHRVEALNRVSTALSAYRLELEKTNDVEAATQYALNVTAETQVNYTTAGTPYLLRKNGWLGAPAAKIVTQFMRYQLGMVQLIGHNFREAWVSKDVSQATREEARKKFYALLTMHTAMTGTSGFFGLSAATAVTQFLVNMFRDDDDELDLEQETKQLMDSMFGKELSVGVRKGLPAMFGLDLSSRLGMAKMLSPFENPFRGEAREAKANLVDMSASLSNLFAWYDWMRDPKASKIPLTLISGPAKAYNLATEGMTTSHGIVKIKPSAYSWMDILAQGLGYTPTKSADAYATQSAVRNQDKAISTARSKLMDEWNGAMNDKDQARITEARKKIGEFNRRHNGQRDVQITQDVLTKSRKQRMSRERRMDESGVYIPKGGEWRTR